MKFATLIILVTLCSLLQVSVISNLPFPFFYVNILAVVLLAVTFYKDTFGISLTLMAIFLLSSYSSQPLWQVGLAWGIIPVVAAVSKKFVFRKYVTGFPRLFAIIVFDIPIAFLAVFFNLFFLSLNSHG